MTNSVAISLSADEALVLFEMLARSREIEDLALLHNAEFLALSSVAAQLERALVEPFAPDYESRLSAARSRLAAGFEGTAPGVRK